MLKNYQIFYHRGSYHTQKCGAKKRGIDFLLSFDEWLKIWEDSGHLDQRGPSKDQYCMARIGDIGPYAVENVKIVTSSENSAEARIGRKQTDDAKKKIGAAVLGRKVSDAARAKMSAAKLGKKLSSAHKEKIKIGKMLGRKPSI